MKEKKIHKW